MKHFFQRKCICIHTLKNDSHFVQVWYRKHITHVHDHTNISFPTNAVSLLIVPWGRRQGTVDVLAFWLKFFKVAWLFQHQCLHSSYTLWILTCNGISGGFKNTYELLNLGALKLSPLIKIHIFQCMGKIFCVEFQKYPLKFHTKCLTHTLKDMILIHCWNSRSSWISELISVFEMPPRTLYTFWVVWKKLVLIWNLTKPFFAHIHHSWQLFPKFGTEHNSNTAVFWVKIWKGLLTTKEAAEKQDFLRFQEISQQAIFHPCQVWILLVQVLL